MIYLDNAATAYPKAPGVGQAIADFLDTMAANPGRSGHRLGMEAARMVWKVRQQVACLIGADQPEEVVFTKNATEGLNLALLGGLREGDHLLISAMEHNAVARPAHYLSRQGVEVEILPCDGAGIVETRKIKKKIKPNTRMIAVTHASNVTGGVMPVEEIGRICREAGKLFLVDASQTAGMLPWKVGDLGADLVAFPGHKGLLGPTGIGALYIRKGVVLKPLHMGGTGSHSESLDVPDESPDRYEAGTLNTTGIAGLGASLSFVMDTGLEEIRRHEQELIRLLLEGLFSIPGVNVLGPKTAEERTSVVGFTVKGLDAAEIGFLMDTVFDIAVRTGLHCSPLAHQTMGTLKTGAVRVSLSYFNTASDIISFIKALEQIVAEMG